MKKWEIWRIFIERLELLVLGCSYTNLSRGLNCWYWDVYVQIYDIIWEENSCKKKPLTSCEYIQFLQHMRAQFLYTNVRHHVMGVSCTQIYWIQLVYKSATSYESTILINKWRTQQSKITIFSYWHQWIKLWGFLWCQLFFYLISDLNCAIILL